MMRMIFFGVVLLCGAVATAGTRYVSAAGDDAADGLTPRTAWRTIGKLNDALRPGETARLRCGDVFIGGISVPGGPDAAHPTVIADYGEGAKPVITCTRTIRPDERVWEAISPSYRIWRTNILNPTNCTGTTGGKANVGFLLVDGKLMPQLRFCKDDVNRPWDFAATPDGWLYVHGTENPARLAKDIRVAMNEMGVRLKSNMVVSNLAIRATGGHGMVGGWDDAVTHVRISDCDLDQIGGAELVGFSRAFRVRYGNGIEFGSNCSDAIVERCTVRGVYDTAFTMQGRPKTSWSDIHFRNCLVADSTQAFEVWCGNAAKGIGFERCSFVGNRTVNVGGGWGAEVRPNRQSATPLLIYSMDTDTVDITVASNRFENVRYGLLHCCAAGGKPPSGYRLFDNTVLSGDVPAWNALGTREEGVKLFTEKVFGVRSVERPENLAFSSDAPDRVMMDGAATRKLVRISYGGPFGTNSFRAVAFIPKTASVEKPVPAFVLICNRDPAKNIDPERIVKSGFWPAEEIVRRGFAAIAFFNGEIALDRNTGNTDGVFACFEDVTVEYRPKNRWGDISAWAWGASRVMDWIETEPTIDAKKVAVVGHSRAGKTALWTAVTDTRFAMSCVNNSGCAGAKLNRMDLPKSEHFADIVSTFPFWFCPNFIRCINRDAELPWDQHQLLALVAPRLLCVASATDDAWAGPEGEFEACRLASPAWESHGLKGLVADGFPPPEKPLQDGSISYHLRTGGHGLTPYDWKAYMDFATRHGW